jgi:L-lactate dehydrogenase complex protein LldG
VDRTLFLERVRRRLGDVRPSPVRIPPDWASEIGDPVARFEHELDAVGGKIHRSRGGRTADALAPILQARGTPAVLIARDGVPEDIEAAVTRAGGKVRWWPDASRDEVASADIGVTGALWAVAETGTVAVSSSPPSGRAPSLLPPVHVAFVAAERIVPSTAELFRRIASMTEFPSNLVLITGPSKSADIGLELTLGVHGPAELHVVLTA